MAASCGFHYQKLPENGAPNQRGIPPPVFCTSVQFSGDSNNHWCTHLSLSSSVLYMQMQQKSIRNSINCCCRRNRKKIAAFVKIAILFWPETIKLIPCDQRSQRWPGNVTKRQGNVTKLPGHILTLLVTFFVCLVTKLFTEAGVDLCLVLWLSV